MEGARWGSVREMLGGGGRSGPYAEAGNEDLVGHVHTLTCYSEYNGNSLKNVSNVLVT